MERIGYYCWAGPGTIRMIKLKYFNPPVDEDSLMSSYDYGYLSQVKEKFGVTDFWATYSWGFSEETEAVDRQFLIDRIGNFKQLGLRLHAYIQGPNLVYKEFKGVDWFCEDERARPVTYYRGRRVVCINNPDFRSYFLQKVEKASTLGFDGIYIDNIQMGQLAIPTYDDNLPFVFAGCHCKYCQGKYKQECGTEIPTDMERNAEESARYLGWRVRCVSGFLHETANIVHNHGLQFGTNSFDPKFNTEYVFGTNISELVKIQDYLLFENHSLPGVNDSTNNTYIADLIKEKEIRVPVFVLSYKRGIGSDSRFSQEDLDNIYTEDQAEPFYSMIKGSEYVTEGIWHNLRVEEYGRLKANSLLEINHRSTFHDGVEKALLKVPLLKKLLKRYYNPLETWFLESHLGRRILMWVYSLALR